MTATALEPVDATTDDFVHFGLVELDLLATNAGVPFPFPLRVPSFGRIAGEREVLMAAAVQTLAARGLADENGPCGAAADVVTALRQYRGTIHLVVAGPEGATGHVAIVYQSWALLCEQALDDNPASTVRTRRIKAITVADELLAKVPEVAPARSMPITLPAHAVDTATELIAEIKSDDEKERRLRDLVRDCGGDPDSLDQLSVLVSVVTGRGQLGATRRDGRKTVPAGRELSWLDGPLGRVQVNRATEGWVSVNPLRRDGVRFALHERAVIARAPQ